MISVARAPVALGVSSFLGLLWAAAAGRAQADGLMVVLEAEVNVKQHVHSLAFSPDGKVVAVGGADVHLFDVDREKPEKIATLPVDNTFGLPCLHFSPNGKFLAVAGSDETVRVWSVGDGSPREVSNNKVHTATVRAVAFSPNGKQLVTAGDDAATVLWDVAEDGKLTQRFLLKKEERFHSPVRGLAFNGRIGRIITVNTQGDIRFLTGMPDKLTQASLLYVRVTDDPVIAVAPDGKGVSVSAGNHILTQAGRTLKGHKEAVTGLAYSPSGQSLASCSRDGRLMVWGAQTTRVRFSLDRGMRFTCVAYPPPPPEGKVGAEALLVAADDKGQVLFLKLGPKEKK